MIQKITLTVTILVTCFLQTANAVGGRCLDNGTHPGQNWQRVCDLGASQMAQYPDSQAASICQGYAGCEYIPPYYYNPPVYNPPVYSVGRCLDSGTHPGQNWQRVCDLGASQMAQYPSQAASICQGYAGCVYIP